MIIKLDFEKHELENYKLNNKPWLIDAESYYLNEEEWVTQYRWHLLNRKGFRLHKPRKISFPDLSHSVALNELLERLDD